MGLDIPGEKESVLQSNDCSFNVSIDVRDCTSPPNIQYQSFILPANICVDDLISQISERSKIKANICLNFMGVGHAGSTQICLNDFHCSLATALDGVPLQPNCKLFFMLTLADDVSPRKVDNDLSSIEYSPQNNSCASSSPLPAIAESINLPGGDPSVASHSEGNSMMAESAFESPAKRFVGLVNQAMTCYLNSLIQTLFMTPEFRNAIYEWDPSGLADDISRSRSIPYQLQRLFLRLQFSTRQAVETTALTTSFGWDTSEVWEQHDVQELCRILLDALESAWRGTDKADLIDHLYQGKMEDYVQCLACDHCSSRVVKYQDISLAIRSFDAQVSYGTLHDALAAFTKPETLTDDNRYYCEKCQQKQDAMKGLRFHIFPRVVTIQLKRFDFDYRFGNRVKLNDRIFFPNFINFDRYVDGSKHESSHLLNPSCVGAKTEIDGELNADIVEDSNGMASANKEFLDADDPDDGSPCRYELFSVLVHSGSASGGHYYAYIKNFEDGHFYCFNDRVVRRVGDEEIRNTYGSGAGGSSAYSYSTSAYMLMYRICDKSRPTNFLLSEELHSFPWLAKQLEEVNRTEVGADSYHPGEGILSKANKYDDISTAASSAAPTYLAAVNGDPSSVPITVYYIHPEELSPTPSRVRLPPSTTLTEAAEVVVKELNLDKVLLSSRVRYRLVPYNNYTKVLGTLEPFSADAAVSSTSSNGVDECVEIPVSEFMKSSNTAFFLEVLPTELPFRQFANGNVTLCVNLVDGAEMRIAQCAFTSVPPSWTIGKIGTYITQLMALPTPHVRMGIIERNWPGDDTIRHLVKADSTLDREKLTESPLDVYVESLSEPEDVRFPFRRTSLHSYIDFQINSTALSLNIKLDRPNVPIVTMDPNAAATKNDDSKVLPNIVISSSQLSGIALLPPATSNVVDGYIIKCAFSKSDDDMIVISVKADRRLTVADLAQSLASILGLDPCTTVIWRDYGGHSEEQLRSSLCLEFLSTSSRLSLRSGKVLTENEYVINVYQMEDAVKKGQPSVDRFSIVVELEWSIFKTKQLVASFLKVHYGIDCCTGTAKPDDSRCCSLCSGSTYHLRLRRNRFSEPSRILASSEILGKDCEWSSVRDIYFELITEGPELKQNATDLIVKARYWHPSQLVLDSPVDICLTVRSVQELTEKIVAMSKISADNIEVASCSSAAATVSLLDMQEHLRWNTISSIRDIDVYPLMLHDDGAQFYFRDKTEELAQIDAERRRQIINQESISRPSNGITSSSTSSSAFASSISSLRVTSRPKEKSLKIYTHQSSPPPPSQPSSTSIVAVPVPPATSPTGVYPLKSSSLDANGPESTTMDVDKPQLAANGLDVD